MRALSGGIPRGFKNQKTPEGFAYRGYCVATLARLGALPPSARPMLREAGRITVELDRLAADLEDARRRGRRRDAARIRRQQTGQRMLLLRLEERMELQAAASRSVTPTQAAALATSLALSASEKPSHRQCRSEGQTS